MWETSKNSTLLLRTTKVKWYMLTRKLSTKSIWDWWLTFSVLINILLLSNVLLFDEDDDSSGTCWSYLCISNNIVRWHNVGLLGCGRKQPKQRESCLFLLPERIPCFVVPNPLDESVDQTELIFDHYSESYVLNSCCLFLEGKQTVLRAYEAWQNDRSRNTLHPSVRRAREREREARECVRGIASPWTANSL